MSTSTASSSVQPGFFKRVLSDFVASKLGARYKRMIFMSSIYGLIQQVKDPDLALVQKLNDVLKLSHYPEAFQLPIKVKSLIWTDCKEGYIDTGMDMISFSEIKGKELPVEKCRFVARYFSNRAPNWLRYATPETMEDDVIRLIQQMKRGSKTLA